MIQASYISEVPAPSPAPGPRAAPRAKRHVPRPVFKERCVYTDYTEEAPCKESSFSWDPVAALEIEIETLLVVLNHTIVRANKVDKDPSTSAKSRECLDVCFKNYNSPKDGLNDALKAIAVEDLELSRSTTDLRTCDKTFAEMGIKLPFSERSSYNVA